MTEDLDQIETHLKDLEMPQRIDFDKACYTINPGKFFEAHFDMIRGGGSENLKKPYQDRVVFAYKAVLKHNGL